MSGQGLNRLRERATVERPPAWKATEPGEVLAGRLVRYESAATEWGTRHIAVIEDADGAHHVAIECFKEQRPAPGELLALAYLGRRETSDGRPYTAYRLEVDREPEDFPEAPAPDYEGPPL